MCFLGQSRREELCASFQRDSGVPLVPSESCMEKELDGNLLWSCFCLCLFLLKLWLKERKGEIKVQLSGVSFWRNLLE